MKEKFLLRTLCCLVAIMACGTVMAQRTVVGSGRQIAIPSSPVVVPYRDTDSPDAMILIFKNLGPSPTDLYVTTNGYLVTGPSDVTFGGPDGVGVQFIPKVNCHATKLLAAIGYIEGTKKVRLGVYTDNAGAVGTLIQDGVTTVIPNFGVCCTLTKVTLAAPGAALTAGTKYWLVATSDSTAPDFGGAWAFIPNGQSFNNSGTSFLWDVEWTYYAACEVMGTSP